MTTRRLQRGAVVPVLFLALTHVAYAAQESATPDPNSLRPLLIITLSVLALVAVFFAIAAAVGRRRHKPTRTEALPQTSMEAVSAVASLEKARTIAKTAKNAQDQAPV
ncbi:MAG: hypothetical protein Q7T86_16805 [Hyphomicrobiaceae bacterium]|nr:hypothetical protein [Hyphomicrobiaceae bacterium]